MVFSIIFIIYTFLWLAICQIDTSNERFIVTIILPMSLLELVIMVVTANNILKPIMYIFSQISIILKNVQKKTKKELL